MISLKVRGEDFSFSVPDEPGIYRVEDPEGYVAPGFQSFFFFAHDGQFGSEFMFEPKGSVSELDLPAIGSELSSIEIG